MEEAKESGNTTGKSQKRLNISIPMNPWMFSTVILGIIVIVLLVIMYRGGVTGNVVSTNNIANVPSAPVAPSAQAATAPVVVPKSDKPVAEAFVFSYCPYGLQFEKALAPVYDLLKDKSNIEIVFIGAMHGEYEKVESFRQICVQKLYGKDKLWQYLKEFNINTDLGNCRGDATCIVPFLDKIYSNNKMDKSKIEDCMNKDAEKIYNQNMARAKELGISGSPTFVINNAKANVNRSPDAIKTAICSSFNKAPSACDSKLSTTNAGAGFGTSAGAAASASC